MRIELILGRSDLAMHNVDLPINKITITDFKQEAYNMCLRASFVRFDDTDEGYVVLKRR